MAVKWNKDTSGTLWMTVSGWTWTIARNDDRWDVYLRHPIYRPDEALVGGGHETLSSAKRDAEREAEVLARQ